MAEKSLEAHFIECLEKGNTKKAKYITQLFGDDVNKLYKGKSPLVWAKKFYNAEVIKALEEKGAIEEVISDEEASKLGQELIEASLNGDTEKVVELIEAGADINLKNKFNRIALIEASRGGYIEIVEKLLEAGAEVDLRNKIGETALMEASSNGRIEIVEKLLKARADVNLRNKIGETALMKASENEHVEVIEKLIEKGADVNLKNDLNQNATEVARNIDVKKVILGSVKEKKAEDKEKEPSFMDKVKGLFERG